MTAGQYADKVIEELCADPRVWATHGMPNETKMAIIRDMIEEAISEYGWQFANNMSTDE
jgi:Cft2 family RNA processing exonuclease